MRLVLATANPDKAREIAGLLPGVELVPRPEAVGEVDETEDTLEGNARLKARAVAAVAGEPAVADDTGLEVDALDGRPGVMAARYAGEGATYADNVALLLEELAGAAAADGLVAGPGSAPSPWWRGPTAVRSWPTAWWRDTSRSRPAAHGGSATTRCSCRTTETAGRSPR